MSLTPHVKDENKDKVKAHISKLEKSGTAQAADTLKEQFNMGNKSNIVVPKNIQNK